ncbi:hypothetical protein [Pelagibacterium sediminicola]|uniref:hypothetical protein n=1 Tax=Pelagibacterium sediminicola TaxID=2248761 RepID=UPI0013002A96|nr:hypothetical protein [Pelagibacterium sediminicola]
MPVQSVESSPGHRVIVTTCEGCGARADFGEDVDLRRALSSGDKRYAGRWWCGWDVQERKPVCKAIKQEGKAG